MPHVAQQKRHEVLQQTISDIRKPTALTTEACALIPPHTLTEEQCTPTEVAGGNHLESKVVQNQIDTNLSHSPDA